MDYVNSSVMEVRYEKLVISLAPDPELNHKANQSCGKLRESVDLARGLIVSIIVCKQGFTV